MKILAGRSHLGIYQLASLLVNKQTMTLHEMRQHLCNGAIPPKKTKLHRDRENAIKNLKKLYDDKEMPILDYLHGVSINIALK